MVKIEIWRSNEVRWINKRGEQDFKHERQSEDIILQWHEIFYIFASSILFGDRSKETIARNLFVRRYGITRGADSCEITQADFDAIVRKLVARQLIDIEGDAVSRRFSLLDFGRRQFDLISDRFEGIQVKSEVVEITDASFAYEDSQFREQKDF